MNKSPGHQPESFRDSVTCKIVVGGIAIGATAIFAVPLAVAAIGFTSGGIAAGSTAASMMSILGGSSTAAGGVVATLQSVGAVGAISKTAVAAWTGFGVVATAASGINITGYYTNVDVSTIKNACSKVAECKPKAIEIVNNGINKTSNLASGTVTMTKNAYSRVAGACNISK